MLTKAYYGKYGMFLKGSAADYTFICGLSVGCGTDPLLCLLILTMLRIFLLIIAPGNCYRIPDPLKYWKNTSNKNTMVLSSAILTSCPKLCNTRQMIRIFI
jgi:hypothetical protein